MIIADQNLGQGQEAVAEPRERVEAMAAGQDGGAKQSRETAGGAGTKRNVRQRERGAGNVLCLAQDGLPPPQLRLEIRPGLGLSLLVRCTRHAHSCQSFATSFLAEHGFQR